MSTPIITKCPHCHNLIELAKAGQPATGDGWRRIVASEMHTTAAAPWSTPGAAMPSTDFATYERKQPAREPNVQSDVVVPALQAGLTGLAVGIPGAAIMGLLGYTTGQALATGMGLAMATISGTWLVKMDMHTKLLWLVESATGRDIDGDGTTGQPLPPPVPIRLEVDHRTAEGGQIKLVSLPGNVSAEVFNLWASQVTTGAKTLARANWIGAGQPFSRDGYDKFIAALEQAGIVRAVEGQGRQLTAGGRRSLARLLNSTGGQAAAGNGGHPGAMPDQNGAGGRI